MQTTTFEVASDMKATYPECIKESKSNNRAQALLWLLITIVLFVIYTQQPEKDNTAQLYEAISYAVFGLIGWWLYKRMSRKVGTGFFFGYCLTNIFLFRFFVEFFKEVQSDFEVGMPLDMGQLLSIPFVLLGVWCMVKSFNKTKTK